MQKNDALYLCEVHARPQFDMGRYSMCMSIFKRFCLKTLHLLSSKATEESQTVACLSIACSCKYSP
jgi:hypothetical protein